MHRESFHEVLSLSICSVIKQRMQKRKIVPEFLWFFFSISILCSRKVKVLGGLSPQSSEYQLWLGDIYPCLILLHLLLCNQYQSILKEISPGCSLKDWCRSWNSNTLATSCEELTHWKRLWCWQGLGAGREGDDRGWDGWMASLTWWTWIWVNSRSWVMDREACMLRFMGLQRVGHDWATELNWTETWINGYEVQGGKNHSRGKQRLLRGYRVVHLTQGKSGEIIVRTGGKYGGKKPKTSWTAI